MPKLAEKEWFLYITRNVSFWASCLTTEGNFHHFPDFGIDIKFPMLVVVLDGTESHYFSHEPEYSRLSQTILNSSIGEKRLKELKKNYEKYGKELLDSLEICAKDLTLKNWIIFVRQYKRYSAGLNVTAILGRVGADALRNKLLSLGVPEERIPATNAIITYPKEHTPLFISQYDLYKLADKKQKNNLSKAEIKALLKKWLEKYRHTPVNFTSEPWTMADARSQFASISSKDVSIELKHLVTKHKKRVKEADRLLKSFNDKELYILARTIAYATYLNEYRKNIFSKVSLNFRPIFKRIAKKCGSNEWKDCFYLTPDETIAILQGKKINLQKIKKKRLVAGVYMKEGKLETLSQKNAKIFRDHIRDSKKSSTEMKDVEIKGYSANKGIVKGVVKIVTSSKDFHKLKRGNILVAVATSVDFVPVMDKAAAFITDEGGICSHASIVSREMDKPCIIGTKIATKVLKDGDLVEVDAEKGVVKILKKSK